MRIVNLCEKIISGSFALLFFLTPLVLTPWNFELFEYNKMMLVYSMTIIIVGAWLVKMVLQKKILFRRTPFDLPLLLFLLSQIVSTFVSIDPHVSLWGYYSRSNGGLLSTISYLALYYAFVANIKLVQLDKLVKFGLVAGLVVSLYGILEHFGIDKNFWVQDVQNRVFSTLGQPNWLAAYLAILIPISISFLFTPVIARSETTKQSPVSFTLRLPRQSLGSFLAMTKKKSFPFYFLLFTFYLCLLFTKSRSGFLGLGIGMIVFVMLNLFEEKLYDGKKYILIFISFFLLTVFVGTPWTPSISQIINHKSEIVVPATGPALEAGGTESGEIRKIVWSGALEIARHYPFFGTGPETFAYSYYQFRPVTHNLVSEWDFLYNKAHNEYLNYAASTGFVGLGTYVLLIVWFLIWCIRVIARNAVTKPPPQRGPAAAGQSHRNNATMKQCNNENGEIATPFGLAMTIGLLSAYISILVTNFFGFSVVITSLYFYLIPGMIIVAFSRCGESDPLPMWNYNRTSRKQLFGFLILLLSTFYFLLTLIRFWYADTRFNLGYQFSQAGYYKTAYPLFHQALSLNPQEPFYRDELAYSAARLALAALEEKDATLSAQLALEALKENRTALTISPQNVNFWKTRTKIFYTLEENTEAIKALETAISLSPTDPKLVYNLALLQGRNNQTKEAILSLQKTLALKPNYQDARYALALFYHEAKQNEKAIDQLEYILKNISPTDTAIQNKLKEWKQ